MYCSQCGYNNPVTADYCKNCEISFSGNSPESLPAMHSAMLIYAGFRTRLLAALLDLLVFCSFVILLFLAAAILIALTGADDYLHNNLDTPFFYGMVAFVYVSYTTLMEAGSRGATPGKRWMNIRVQDIHGNRLGYSQAFWRMLARKLSYLTIGTGFLLQPFTPRQQALHDLLASTVVVKENESKKIHFMATLVVLFVALMLPALALFATAGLPLYQQYIHKVQLDKGIKIGRLTAAAVSRFYRNNGRVPATIADTGSYISSSRHVAGVALNPQNGELTVTYSATVRKPLRDRHLIFTPGLAPDNSIVWKCHSNDIEMRYLPDTCQ